LTSGALEGLCPVCVAHAAFLDEPDSTSAPLTDLPATHLRHFGDYELLEEIARGGMGVVFRARQLSLNRIVAVKMILTGQLASPADVLRFRAEAEAAANLQHPNIVAIHEVGQREGQHYFSMDYVEGQNLAQWSSDRGVRHRDWKRVAQWVKALAEAIQYAHDHGTVHRDLKPSNVLIDKLGQVRITDFGLAKRFKSDSELTVTGQIIGTPNFMPPEQAAARRGEVGPPSDIYSLGAILYFLLTGEPPFLGKTTHETMAKVLNEEPVSPRTLKPEVPHDLATICLKCLEKRPHRRYGSAKDLADDLARFIIDEPILACPVGPLEKIWRLCRRHPAASGLLILLLLLLGLGIGRLLARRVVPSLPVLVGAGVSGVIDGKLYVTVAADGYAGNRNYLYVYDPALNRWEKLPSSPLPPANCAAGVLNGKLYLAGGADWKGTNTSQLSVFDPVSNLWSAKASMPTPRTGCVGAVLNGKLYVVGGEAGGKQLATLEIYDSRTDTWSIGQPMRMPRKAPGVAVVGNTLYVVAGNPTEGTGPTDKVEAYNGVKGTWSYVKPLPHLRGAPFVVAWNGTLYVAGGITPGAGPTNFLDAYHPATDNWETLTPMPATSYEGAGAQVMSGGQIWVIGGWTSMPDKITHEPKIAHNEIFIYNPSRDSWSASGREQ
jgi:N-acetylneuraminic acid mutarotase